MDSFFIILDYEKLISSPGDGSFKSFQTSNGRYVVMVIYNDSILSQNAHLTSWDLNTNLQGFVYALPNLRDFGLALSKRGLSFCISYVTNSVARLVCIAGIQDPMVVIHERTEGWWLVTKVAVSNPPDRLIDPYYCAIFTNVTFTYVVCVNEFNFTDVTVGEIFQTDLSADLRNVELLISDDSSSICFLSNNEVRLICHDRLAAYLPLGEPITYFIEVFDDPTRTDGFAASFVPNSTIVPLLFLFLFLLSLKRNVNPEKNDKNWK